MNDIREENKNVIGFKALFDPKNDYNIAINSALAQILLRLLYHPKMVTQRAVAYVQDYWFNFCERILP